MKFIVRINPLLVMVVAGCAPSPEVLHAGASREGWSVETTRSPAVPDAEAPDPTPTPPSAGGGPEIPPAVLPDAAPVVRRDAAADVAPVPPPPAGQGNVCQLAFQVTTVTFGGDYAPRNVGAIWVEGAGGKFVKSLNVWGRRRLRHLTEWESVSGGSTVDAVTAPSANDHSTRMASWDCTGLDKQPVPNGAYTVNVEFTEQNASGRVMTPVPFTRGAGPTDVMPADQANFKNVHLKVTP